MTSISAGLTRVRIAVGGLIAAGMLAAGLAVIPALAQQAPQGAPPRGMAGPGARFAEHCRNMDAHIAAMLAYAQVKLAITDAQKPAWDQFAASVKSAEQPMRSVCSQYATAPEPKTLPERLQRMEALATARASTLQQIRPAVDSFYQQLTPAQQEQADELMRAGGRGMPMHHMQGMHGMGGPEPH